MRFFRFLPLVCLLAANHLTAAGKIFPYPYVQEDLPNGLRLITIPTDYPNIVSLYIVVGAGCAMKWSRVRPALPICLNT